MPALRQFAEIRGDSRGESLEALWQGKCCKANEISRTILLWKTESKSVHFRGSVSL
jgi:hypothetical protein